SSLQECAPRIRRLRSTFGHGRLRDPRTRCGPARLGRAWSKPQLRDRNGQGAGRRHLKSRAHENFRRKFTEDLRADLPQERNEDRSMIDSASTKFTTKLDLAHEAH